LTFRREYGKVYQQLNNSMKRHMLCFARKSDYGTKAFMCFFVA